MNVLSLNYGTMFEYVFMHFLEMRDVCLRRLLILAMTASLLLGASIEKRLGETPKKFRKSGEEGVDFFQ